MSPSQRPLHVRAKVKPRRVGTQSAAGRALRIPLTRRAGPFNHGRHPMKRNAGGSSCCGARRRWLWGLLLLAVFLLHQDWWNWARARPLVWGVLPVGLAYHAVYALGCAGVMALLVRFAWPRDLDSAARATRAGSGANKCRGGTDNAVAP